MTYLLGDQSLYGTEGVLRAPSVQDARNKAPLLCWDVHQSSSKNSSAAASCLHPRPQLLKKLPLYVSSLFANSLPFCALMTSLSLIFFIQASIILLQYQTSRGLASPHPHRRDTLKALSVPLSSCSPLSLLWKIVVPCCSHSLAPVSLCLHDLVRLYLLEVKSPHPSTLCNNQKPKPLSPIISTIGFLFFTSALLC